MSKVRHFSRYYVHSPVTFQGNTLYKRGTFVHLKHQEGDKKIKMQYTDKVSQIEIDAFNDTISIPLIYITEDWWSKLEAGQFIVRNENV